MNDRQKEQFNAMYQALTEIHKWFSTPKQIKKTSKIYKFDYATHLEQSYCEIQSTAKEVVKGVKLLK